MVKHKKTTINAVSFIDLQLKLAKHPNWRILEISRLNLVSRLSFREQRKRNSSASLKLFLFDPH